MSISTARTILSVAVVCALWILPETAPQSAAAAQSYRAVHPAKYRVSRPGDLFYNFYVGPAAYADGTAAGMYPAPLPTPPVVGHTYITYQPLMPHEFLYRHHRTYHRHHPGQGWVKTNVLWW